MTAMRPAWHETRSAPDLVPARVDRRVVLHQRCSDRGAKAAVPWRGETPEVFERRWSMYQVEVTGTVRRLAPSPGPAEGRTASYHVNALWPTAAGVAGRQLFA